MKVTIKIACFSLIVYATLGASAARAADDGIGFLDTLGRENSGRVVLGTSGIRSAAAGYAVPVPFGPMINVDGVFGQGRGYDTNYYRINAFIPMHIVPGESLAFSSLNGGVTEDGKSIGSFGFGYRQYVKSLNRVFSASGWFDFDDGHNEPYYQTGLSFSSMGKYLDLHINGTMIVGQDSNVIIRRLDPAFFVGHNILQNLVTVIENAYSGVDAELGGPLPFIGRYGVSLYVGGYYMNSREDEQTSGVRIRVLSRFSDDATVGMEYTSDGVFGDNAFVNVSLSFPPGRRTRWFRQRPVRERLADRVNRNGRIAARVRAEKQVIFAVNQADNQPYFVIHVDPNRTLQGTGTFENPFNTLETARNPNPAIADIFRVIPRTDGTNTNLAMNDTFVLSGSQRLLASSSTQTFTTIAGTFELPGYTGPGTGPLISNNSLVSSPVSYVIEMTGTNEVRGFIIDGNDSLGNPIHSGIEGVGTSGFSITDNTFQNVVEGVVIANTGPGTGILTSNTFNGNGILSNRAFALNHSAGTLNLTVQSNTVTNHLGEDLDFDGILDPGEDINGNMILDRGIAFEIIASGGSTINASGSMAISNNSAIGNGTGLVLTALAGSTINATIQDNIFNNNNDPNTGANITSDASTINLFAFANNQVNNNGGNGLLLTAQNTGVINSLLSEDLNNNGILDAGEDLNANGFLDLGITGNTITGNAANGIAAVSDNGAINNLHIGGVDDFLPDSSVLGTVGLPDNVLTGNGVGTGTGGAIAFTTLNNGTITGSIVNNTMHNSAANSVSFTSNTGTTTLTSIQNNTLNDNGLAGIFVTGTGGTVDAGTIANNNFDRLISGTSGLLVNATGASFTATVVRNSFIADPVANLNTEFGIGIDMQDGALNLNVGSFFPSDANIFDLNNGAGIGITLRQTATGTFDIRQNSITRTGDLASNADFNGEGVHIRLVGAAALTNSTATLTNSFIRNNTIGSLTDAAMGNASHGIAINVQEETVLQNLDITDNAIGNNGLDGINFLRRDDAVVDAVNIANNTITLNADDGIDISVRNGANDVADFTILNNQITDNVNRGISLNVQADAALQADITDNTITGHGSHGIETSEVVNTATDLRNVTGTWTNNIITDNGGNGILLDGSTSLLTIGQAGVGNGNLVSNNSLAGFLVTAPGSVVIENNIITFNGAGLADIRVGAGIDIEGRGFKNTTLTNNVIRENFGDGLEFNNNSNAGAFSFTLTATGNTIEFNQGRGVDILNQGTADSTMTFNNNKFASNSLEGFYVVNTASTTQTQNVDSTVALLADGLINAIPRLTLNMDNNQIIKNGDGTTFTTTGLIFRVGTSDGGIFDITDPGGFANGGRGGVVATVINHTFGGNFGDDVLFESFVSTVTPAVTAGTWNATTFTVTAFQSEPLARLDLIYINNTVDSTDANNLGAFFNNAELVFKSRDTAQTDPGPFPVGGTRRRNAQRLAARNVDIGGFLLPPATPVAGNAFLYSGMGQSTFRISTGSDMVPFILDSAIYVDYQDAFGVNFAGAVFGELPFGWGLF